MDLLIRGGGWANRLRKFIDQKNLSDKNFHYRVYNLGISGNTTEDLLRRFELEVRERIKEFTDLVIVFQIGINDSQLLISENRTRVSLEQFEKNISKLIEIARKFTNKIIFLGLTPVDEEKVNPIPWRTERAYRNNLIKIFNQTIKTICQREKIVFIEIFDKWINQDYKRFLEDGIHPNSLGHEKLFGEILKPILEIMTK